MNAESEGKGQDFGIGSILVSICSLSYTDQYVLSWLWLYAERIFCVWKAKEVEFVCHNSISEPFDYCLTIT